MKIRRSDYAGDIKNAVFGTILIWMFICFVLFLICIGVGSNAEIKYDDYQAYNEFAEKANEDFSKDQRVILAELIPTYKDDLNEDGVFTEREAPHLTHFWQFLQENWGILLASSLLVLALASATLYFVCHDHDYHFADLPFRSFYGWFVLITSFAVAWPFFIVSRILLWRTKRGQYTISLPEIKLEFNKNEFMAFCENRSPLIKRIEHARAEVSKSEETIEYRGNEIKQHTKRLREDQQELNKRQAALNDLLRQAEEASGDTRRTEQFAHDFEEIKAMRGVKKIYMDVAGDLVIVARAAYEYRGNLYDIGDFKIIIRDGSMDIYWTRDSSGALHYGHTFCLGNNRDVILDYLAEDRLVEAMELVIESINHINEDSLGLIPQKYKQIID